ncbi:MAG: peptidoglycan editing factor PgeF [Ignavibacteriales bacterium]|nr:peptidoglycan editing factor PgeF [Ignavibacteriales bacterium]
MSTRVGGVSPEPLGMNLSYRVGDDPANVAENRKRFFEALGFMESGSAIPHQCHSSNIQIVSQPGEYDACDGLVTQTNDLPLIVSIADCLPVTIYDVAKAVLGLVHAGWRGTAQGIVAETVDLMVKQCGSSAGEMITYLGPSAGVCCYEVGREVAELFSLDQVEQRDDRLYLNLKKANCDQLLGAGVREENIEISPFCTICTPQLFHSHRRDRNKSGRMMATVSLVDHAGS